MVKKADGSCWPCGNDRQLTVPDTCPIRNMMDFAAKAANCAIFSKINLKRGCYQVSIEKQL